MVISLEREYGSTTSRGRGNLGATLSAGKRKCDFLVNFRGRSPNLRDLASLAYLLSEASLQVRPQESPDLIMRSNNVEIEQSTVGGEHEAQ